MADKKYVYVETVSVTKIFDSKYKSKLQACIKNMMEKAINASSKLTTKPPADKKAGGYYASLNLVALEKEQKGNKINLNAEISKFIGTWPDKRLLTAKSSSSATLEGADPNKLDKEVERAVGDLMEAVADTVVNFLEKL